MDSFKGTFFVGGIAMFVLAAFASWILPVWTLSDLEYSTVEEIAQDPIPEWRDLAERWPTAFQDAWGEDAWRQAQLLPKRLDESPDDPAAVEAAVAAYAEALDRGRDLYVAEGCWHCHSQYVRGVSREEERWGKVAMAAEFENELQRPVLWGTRRVGPDLSRQWGVHSNDWQAAHLYDPRSVSPYSVMPSYPWYFQENPRFGAEGASLRETPVEPTRDGFALLTFIQWLGSWEPERPWQKL